jgi:hypothetical protein
LEFKKIDGGAKHSKQRLMSCVAAVFAAPFYVALAFKKRLCQTLTLETELAEVRCCCLASVFAALFTCLHTRRLRISSPRL